MSAKHTGDGVRRSAGIGGAGLGLLMFAFDKLSGGAFPRPLLYLLLLVAACMIAWSLPPVIRAITDHARQRTRMIPFIGMIICGIGLIGFGSWYFWPVSRLQPAASTPHASSVGGQGGVSPIGGHGGKGGDGPVAGGGGAAGAIEHLPGGGMIIHGSGGGAGGGPGGGAGGKGGGALGGDGGQAGRAAELRPLKRLIAYDAPRLEANGKIKDGETTYYFQSVWARVNNVSDETITARVTRCDVFIDGAQVMSAGPMSEVVVQQTQYMDAIVRSHTETELPISQSQKQVRVELEIQYDTIPSTGVRTSGKVVLYDIEHAHEPNNSPLQGVASNIVSYTEK